ncbi:MAG TPA: DUF1906 domain-containing protein [Solirubrobacterales bacterium]|nr:DUF1906 domain-containing protein [Solirubrobacterales bacterium]
MSRFDSPLFRSTSRGLAFVAALAMLAACQHALAPADAGAQTIRFQGERVEAPRGWPVYRLAEHPRMCVRLDRRAVYLGTPGAEQRCPAEATIGPRRAVLVEGAAGAARSSALPVPTRSLAAASAGGSFFTGLGFDACTAPSSRSMAAWAESPYRAIGVYIGGENRGCSQPNLTASWVSTQTAAGWNLIPTYVGLQAPTSACSSCAKISASQATAQGTAAASDAVAQAAALGMGAGSPIYNDMEAYTQTSSATGATLAFLEAWTEKLHSLGYISGVYSSSGSGIEDIADQIGTGYNLPDQLWIANWNGREDTIDPNVPASAWNLHQRIHQYRGGHDERYGGVTINIDNNYVDGATVGNAAPSAANEDPVGRLELTASPSPGQLRVRGWALDKNAPTQPLAIRVYVGGRASAPGALAHELGVVATLSRPDVGARFRQAGALHGFDVSFPTVKSGPQPTCVYAVNAGPGADRLLGCRNVSIPVAVTLSHPRATAAGVRVRVSCEWPAGTQCPGQLALRTRLEITQPRKRGRPAQTRTVVRSLGRRAFRLTGARSHSFLVPFSAGARALLRQRGELRTQLIAAIPGGRRVVVLTASF